MHVCASPPDSTTKCCTVLSSQFAEKKREGKIEKEKIQATVTYVEDFTSHFTLQL